MTPECSLKDCEKSSQFFKRVLEGIVNVQKYQLNIFAKTKHFAKLCLPVYIYVAQVEFLILKQLYSRDTDPLTYHEMSRFTIFSLYRVLYKCQFTKLFYSLFFLLIFIHLGPLILQLTYFQKQKA